MGYGGAVHSPFTPPGSPNIPKYLVSKILHGYLLLDRTLFFAAR